MDSSLPIGGGMKLDHKHERLIVLVASLAGVVGLYFLSKKPAAAASNSAGTNPNGVSGGGSGVGGDGTTGGNTTAPPVLPTVHFQFSGNDNPSLEYQVQHSVNQGGGGSFSFGPIHIGGGGSGSNTTDTHVKGAVDNAYSTDVTIQNADATTLRTILDEITLLAGTQQQRTDTSLQEIQAIQNTTNQKQSGAGSGSGSGATNGGH